MIFFLAAFFQAPSAWELLWLAGSFEILFIMKRYCKSSIGDLCMISFDVRKVVYYESIKRELKR
jgi:hypothetical protein